jgi:hypothetical protein
LLKSASLDAGDLIEVIVVYFHLQAIKFMRARKNSNVWNWYLISTGELNFVRKCLNGPIGDGFLLLWMV